MNDTIFFEIPIYRCTIEKHSEETQRNYQKFAKKCYQKSEEDMRDFFYTNLWHPWKYNDVIGFLNLHILGSQLRAELWKVDKKKYNGGITLKPFKNNGKSLELNIPKDLNSKQIFDFILKKLEKLNKKEFKKRHLDLEAFIRVGEFIDWKDLIKELNPYNQL